ncbi:MAG TPA: ABC transporter ATP-binding protein [Casimicrobiaceae bacterium]|jgi:oligopeptide/dipeptide ABC transporter ATP-binding protein|nr:ABC transporter ATP-binding protein [Casimicrobiaceae bacterium]
MSDSADPILEMQALCVTYDTHGRVVHALQDASVTVSAGEAVGIAGESGSGKSTLARAALGLLPERVGRITAGRVSIAGVDVTRYTPRQWERLRGRPLAIVFQDPLSFLNPVMRVGAQIGESVRRHDPHADAHARCVELLELVKLDASVARRYPHELSGGMRQRVMLAIALGCRPRLLIADEPTTALDATTQTEILALLRSLRESLDMSLLVISHDLGLLRWNCDRVYVMYAGHTVEHGRTEDVLQRSAHPYTRGLVEASRMRRRADGRFATIGGDVPDLRQRYHFCPFVARCAHAFATCREAMPPALPADGADHTARCWLLQSQTVPA